jgi:hypothetical protein
MKILHGWFTWLLVGAVIAVGLIAGVDALRSSDQQPSPSTPTASTTTTRSATGPVRRCTRLDIRVTIEVLGGLANIVVRNIGLSAYRMRAMPVGRTVYSRAGKAFHVDRSAQEASEAGLSGTFAPGAEWHSGGVNLPCAMRGPFRMVARVGPYTAHESNLSFVEAGCS